MFSALASRLKPKPAPDHADLPDADAIEDQLRAAQARADAAVEADTPFVIRVHDQGRPSFDQNFPEGEIVIGADPECDIVITDIDEAEVLVVKLERIGAACLITLTALCHGISARGRDLPVGRPMVFPDRAAFTIAGDYAFDIAFIPGRVPMVEKHSAPAALLAGAALFAATGWILSQPTPRPPPPAPAEVTSVAPTPEAGETPTRRPMPATEAETLPEAIPLPEPPASEAAVTPAPEGEDGPGAGSPDPASLDAAQGHMREMLAAANLLPPLQVVAADGRISVEGALTGDERARAMEVMQGVRERHPVTIEMAIESDPPATPFITAIVLSPETFVIGSDGRRYAVGQRLPDGGRIEKIDENAIVVNRDGLLERVNYTW